MDETAQALRVSFFKVLWQIHAFDSLLRNHARNSWHEANASVGIILDPLLILFISPHAAAMQILVRFRNGEREPDPARDGVRLTSASKYYFSNAPANEYVMGFTAITALALREGVSRLQRAWSPRAKGAKRAEE